jgi:hypothetical protein
LHDRESEALSADTTAYSKSNFSIDNKLEIKSKVMVINARRDKIIQNNRAFQALRIYIFYFFKNCFQCNYNLKNAEKQRILALLS